MQELKAIWDEFPKSPVETPDPAVRERGKLAEIMNEEKTEEIEIVKSEPDVEYQEVPLKTTEEPKEIVFETFLHILTQISMLHVSNQKG